MDWAFHRRKVFTLRKKVNQPSIGVGELMFPIAQKYVNDLLLVTDESIQNAQQVLWNVLRVVAEPGGAAALAALLSHRYQPKAGERVGVLVCGGNTTAVDFKRAQKNGA